ncbi:MAG: energy transducer TonB [Chitinophaga sp.]|uniref:M56 family metallopeptidase n=1 Tax=Chitinophaga sp. TaxID=1869181 RepID=UPI001B16C49A|nr:M56 family metallopeptidase [Chitinophaga sp.]MBO9727133.1 energy transducer TonB [Chitinophaga sp.]
MPTLFLYILQASGCMTLLYLLYITCFKRETFYRYNRILLLSAFICSALLPLLPVPALQSAPAPDAPNTMVYFNNTPSAQVHTSAHPVATSPWWEPLMQRAAAGMLAVYIGIALLLLLVHALQLIKIRQLAKTGQAYTQNNIRYVQISGLTAPFSFLRMIFFDPNAHEPTELQHILRHEEAHVQQRHTVDILLSALYCCICWINPFAWLCKKSLQLNLEYLADEAALQAFDRSTDYQFSLIKVGTLRSPVGIVSHFSKSFIKNRILMMNKTQSPRMRTWRYLLLLPVLCLTAGLLSATSANKLPSDSNKYLLIEKGVIHGMVTPLTTDRDLADMKVALRAKGVSITFSGIKRNAAGEITNIGVEATYRYITVNDVSFASPIKPIFFYFGDDVGIGLGPQALRQTPKVLIDRAIAESNGWLRGITTDSSILSRFPGGEEAYRKTIARNTRYPRLCLEENIVGDVWVQYKIQPNGTITDVEVLEAAHKALGEEVKRVVSSFPSFKADPAGKTETVTLSVAYILEDDATGKHLEGIHTRKTEITVVGFGIKK